jgi:hypothetical protein
MKSMTRGGTKEPWRKSGKERRIRCCREFTKPDVSTRAIKIPNLVYTIAKAYDPKEIIIWNPNLGTVIPIEVETIRQVFKIPSGTEMEQIIV